MGGSLLAKLGLDNSAELKKSGRLQLVVDHYDSILQRSIYRPVIRTEMHMAELLDTFDFPGRDEMTGRRQTSTNATQALLLMNGPFVLTQARHTARALLAANLPDDAARVRRLYEQALGRRAEHEEVAAALDFIESFDARLQKSHNTQVLRNRAWQGLCQAVFMFNEFVYLD